MATTKQVASYLRLSIPGLSLGGSIGKIISTAIKENWNQNQLLMAVYKSPAFKARFPGIFTGEGSLIMSPAAYLQRERELRNVMKDYGIYWMHFNNPDDLAPLIKRGIDAAQLTRRLELSQQLLKNNPDIVKQLQAGWGISAHAAANGALAWLLQPGKGTQYFEQIVTAAQGRVAARQAGFDLSGATGISKQFFLGLAGRGITGEQMNQAFAQAGGEWAQFKTLAARYAGQVMQPGETATDTEFAAALFSPNPRIEALRKNLVSQEQAQFRASSSFAMAGGRGVAGLQTDEGEDR